MSGYTPVFDSIYSGSLYGQWPAAALMATLLPLCDKNGHIDLHPRAIAAMTGWPMELLEEGIQQLMAPDPDSRTTAEQGRRLIPLDNSRSWGWAMVNFVNYREKARLLAKSAREVESGRNAARMQDRRGPPVTACDPLSNANTNANTDKNSVEEASTAPAKPNPVSEVFGYWQETMNSPHSRLSDKRARAIKARLKDGYTVEQLKRAVFGCSVTPHNMGFNERDQKYNDIELICRDAGHVDRFIANAARPPKLPEARNG